MNLQDRSTVVTPNVPTVSACLLTGAQRAAVATISLKGVDATATLQRFFSANSSRPIKPNELRYGQWCSVTNHAESVVVVQLPNEQVEEFISTELEYEIHCHGGEQAARRILKDLEAVHVVILDHTQYAAVQYPNRLIREANEAVSRTLTIRTARFALQQLRTGLHEYVVKAREQLSQGQFENVVREAEVIQRFSAFGLHLTKPWRIVLAGLPNVGKSSLMNALVGFQRSITYDLPGTTRDVVTCDGAIDGWPVLFSDTAGIRDRTSDAIEQQGVERAKAAISQADLVVMVHDATSPDDPFPVPLPAGKDRIEVINKVDRKDSQPCRGGGEAVLTSAVTGAGIRELIQAIASALVPALPSDQQAVPLNERQTRLVSELAAARDESEVTSLLNHLELG